MPLSRYLSVMLLLFFFTSIGFSDTLTSQSHSKLTDGIIAASNPSDSAWVVFNKDSTQLPTALPPAPNKTIGYYGTGEFRNTADIGVEISIENLLKQAGMNSYRHTVYWQLFAEPNTIAPYWNWSWYESHTDGQRIRRAINNSMVLDLVAHKVPRWANKSLPIEHPPMQAVIEEQIILNDMTPANLSHKFILGEKNEQYDKANVVLSGAATQSVSNETVGTGNGTEWQEFTLSHNSIVPGTLKLSVNRELWQEVEFFRGSNTLDKKAFVFFPNTGKIRFGDSWNGPILSSGTALTASYSYYSIPFREYSTESYNSTESLDYRIDYSNGTIRRTANSTIPNNSTVKVTYYYLETTWWQRFWKELVQYYGNNVSYYEVWNEENLEQSFPGTEDQYVELLKTAYPNIKSANNNATVLLGGLGFGSGYLQSLYSKGAKNYFDAIAWHPYGWELGVDNPNSHFNILNNEMRSVAVANNDSTKPVFLNEWGFSSNQSGGMTQSDQGIALSRSLMKIKKMDYVNNISWWGVVDEATIGTQETDKYFYHLGLLAYNSSNQLQYKPSYYSYKNIATNKGTIIDLANYNPDGTIQAAQFAINKIIFYSYGNDIDSVKIYYSQQNSNDWQQATVNNLSVSASDKNTFKYTIIIPQTTMRFIQLQIVKKTNVTDFLIDEIQAYNTTNTNIALNKYYSTEGFKASFLTPSPNLCGNNKPDTGETCQNCPNDVSCQTGCSFGQITCNNQCTTPFCSNAAQCDDNNVSTIDSCNNSGTCSATCSYCNMACSNNSQCNDNNAITTDACNNSGTCNSNCSHTACPITCNNNSQCNDNNTLTSDSCNSSGTCSSSCSHCAIACNSDIQCSDNNSQTTDSCNAAGTCSANCSHVTIVQNPVCGNNIIESNEQCDTTSLNGKDCVSIGFSSGTLGCASTCTFDSNDCISTTPDTGTETPPGGNTGGSPGGSTGNSCTPACTGDSACNDNNPCTIDSCSQANTCTAKCVFSEIQNCKTLLIIVPGTVTAGMNFSTIITDKFGNLISGATVKYNNSTRITGTDGKATFKAIKGIEKVFATKTGYSDANISFIVNSDKKTTGPKKTINLSAPNTVAISDSFVVAATDEEGNPAGNILVSYGSQEKYTDEKGTVVFNAEKNANYVLATDGIAQAKQTILLKETSILESVKKTDPLFAIAALLFILMVLIPFIKH